MQRDFKGVWIPKEIWLDKSLTFQEKIILVEIDSYDDGVIGCFASNKHFVNNFGINSSRISQVIQSLQRKGYINIDYEYNGKEIQKRYIHINRPPYPEKGMLKNNIGMLKNEMGVCQFPKGGYVNFLKDNNTSINNTNINNKEIYKESISKEVIDRLNELTNSNFKHKTKNTQELINGRLNEGYSKEDLIMVVEKMCYLWNNPKKGEKDMREYLRPSTLFRPTNFENYYNKPVKEKETTIMNSDIDLSDF